MALILAIESDKRQVNYLTAMVRGKLHAELVIGDTAEGALARLGDRVPDLILTSPLLSPKDEQALGDRLRRLNGVAAHVQTLTLPVFAQPTRAAAKERGGMLSVLLGDRTQASAPDGCDPAVFAEQCKEYLRRSEEEREARRHDEPNEAMPAATGPDENVDDGRMAGVDIDLSGLLDDEERSMRAAPAEEEPPVYDLSTDPGGLDAAIVNVSAPVDETPVLPESPEGDFDDWQNVIDALKRESAQVRVPRERKPDPQKVQAAPAVPEPAVLADPDPDPELITVAATEPAPMPVDPVAELVTVAAVDPAPSTKIATAEPPKRRLRAAQDEWGMFDPAQAGMEALYQRLEKITQDEERR